MQEYLRVFNNEKLRIIPLILFLIFTGVLFFLYEFYNGYFNTEKFLYLSLTPIFIIFIWFIFDRQLALFLSLVATLAFGLTFVSEDVVWKNEYSLILLSYFLLLGFLFLFSVLDNKNNDDNRNNRFKKNGPVFTIFFYWIMISLILIITGLVNNNYTGEISTLFFSVFIISFLFYVGFFIVIYLGNWIIDLIYNNYFRLEKFTKQEKTSFYKMFLFQDAIKNYIKKEKIEFGALACFNINKSIFGELNSSYVLEYIRDKIDDNYVDSLFLRIDSDTYGIFFKLNKFDLELEEFYKNNEQKIRGKDFFKYLEDIFINIKIINYENEIKLKKLRVGISLYGVSTNDMNSLIYNSKSLLKENLIGDYRSIIQVFNFKKQHHDYLIKEPLKDLDMEFYSSSLNINYYISTIESKNIYYYKISFKTNDKKETYLNAISKQTQTQKDLFDRYLAYEVLKDFFQSNRKGMIVINYPINYLSAKDFAINSFEKKLKSQNIDPKKIIIRLEYKEIFLIKNDTFLIKNIYSLQKIGINFSINNLTEKITDKLKPDFLEEIVNYKFDIREFWHLN